mgnify:CR=1 FL=1
MEYKFSNRALSAKPSRIREISARGAIDPEFISFAIGNPAYETFPVEEIRRCNDLIYERCPKYALQYGPTIGDDGFRELMKERLQKIKGINPEGNDILVTSGSQQGLTLMPMTVTNEGDVVLVEQYTYMGALSCMRGMCAVPVGVKVDDDGINLEALEEACKTIKNVRYLYLIPNFQNPTGLTYTQAVRERAAAILKAAGTPVIEDNPYGELRFHGEGGSSFAELLGEQCAAMGTFSKIVAPGMRIGWIACKQPELYAKLLAFKSTMDLHTNIFGQMVLAEYLLDNDLDEQIEKIKVMYREKAEKMMDCMAKDFPESVSYTKPEGGMFIWATMPEGLKAVDVMQAAAAKGVAVCPGDPFYEEERGVRTMRINYSNSSDEAIEKGIKILGDTIKEMLAK